MSDAVHIEDLARPRFTPEVDEIRAAMASMADDCVLEPGALLQRARDESGLDDFGDRSFEEPLGVLRAGAASTPPGSRRSAA